ncbi:competence type IV pilus minor pilin ComGG [Peribacillus acanthi]|uniref:competence type IV pilus minor pilin ComGG n=1 Tax=Peribacillus acanthi TaxID=2171554 RepID=UPI00130073CD|nr:competence type IV pilus minor pilin ComGG [Peribacillus acanthi]
MFHKSLCLSNNQLGVVFPYLLMLLLLICLLVENKVREYVSYRNFIIETESKLVSEHLMYMASHNSAHFENIQPGVESQWFFPRGEVLIKVESIEQEKAQISISAITDFGGKAQARVEYDIMEKKIIGWLES